ncbi:hypothetical protein C2845_PM10G00590 [Panicum miliaceum]|uniref:Uncharacterized protein n=3 Tax=PACMAD clade TaxID=147370 RepID=A0A3L6PBD5_PANMI|nr:hypothetical protein C2845_PM10G00590 [Panicum miliaceum]
MALASIKFLEWLFGSCFSSSWTAAREAGSFGVRTEEEEVPRAPAIRRPPRLGRLAWGVLNFSDLLSAGEQSYLGLLLSRISFCAHGGAVPPVVGRLTTVTMSGKYIIAGLAASFVIAYGSDVLVAQKKVFGGTTPRTVSDKEWWEATDKQFQAWPRTAGPPVVMNPISRQNFIVKDLKP